VDPIHLLLDNPDLWLPCKRALLFPMLPVLRIPCIDGVWLLIVIRLFPSALVSFVDLAVAYQVCISNHMLGAWAIEVTNPRHHKAPR
jgi:hypothetical protein